MFTMFAAEVSDVVGAQISELLAHKAANAGESAVSVSPAARQRQSNGPPRQCGETAVTVSPAARQRQNNGPPVLRSARNAAPSMSAT